VSIGRNSRWPQDMKLPYSRHFKCKSVEILGFERIIELKITVKNFFENLKMKDYKTLEKEIFLR
jgi:hypothetical protein